MDYENDLRVLKGSFEGGGEGAFYQRALALLASRDHLDWLDIGIGRDGSSLHAFVAACRERGQSIAITGIDPDASPVSNKEKGVSWHLIRSSFQDWSDSGQFDIINADQSLYYVGDISSTLKRVLKLLRPGGIFIASCWSRQDALRLLRKKLFPASDETLAGEELVELVRAEPGFSIVETDEFRTSVRLHAWREDARYLGPALRVIARRSLSPEIDPGPSSLRALLEDLPDVAQRINVALYAVRAEAS